MRKLIMFMILTFETKDLLVFGVYLEVTAPHHAILRIHRKNAKQLINGSTKNNPLKRRQSCSGFAASSALMLG